MASKNVVEVSAEGGKMTLAELEFFVAAAKAAGAQGNEVIRVKANFGSTIKELSLAVENTSR